ncbi:MAG: DUF4179 domain-containing protein [Sarcina sp.]
MDDKNLKDLIDIPKGLDDAVLKGISRGRKQKKASNNKFIKKGLIAAGLACVITTGIGVVNPKFVSAVPGLNKVMESFHKEIFGGSLEKYSDISTIVGSTVIDNGVSITFEEFVFDENNLMATLMVTGEKIENFKTGITYVNGSFIADGSEMGVESKVQMINPTTAMVILEQNIAKENIADNSKIKLEVRNITGDGAEPLEGKWDFAIEGEKTKGTRIKSDVQVETSEGSLNIKEVVMTDISTTIIMRGQTDNPTKSEYDNDGSRIQSIEFVAKDDKGNVYTIDDLDNGLNTRTGELDRVLTIRGDLTDAKYIEISEKVGGKIIDKEIEGVYPALLQFNGEGKFEEKIITRKPTKEELEQGYGGENVNHFVNISNEFKTLDDIIGDKIEVSKSQFIEITNIEDTELGTKFTFKTDGVYDYHNLAQLQVFDEEMNDMINGEDYRKYRAIEDEKNHVYSITIESLDRNKKYTVGIPKVTELENPSFTMKVNLK